jgi:hypothetical protein
MAAKVIHSALIIATTALISACASSGPTQGYYRYCGDCSYLSLQSCCSANYTAPSSCSTCNYGYNYVDYHPNGYYTTYMRYDTTPY